MLDLIPSLLTTLFCLSAIRIVENVKFVGLPGSLFTKDETSKDVSNARL